MSRRSTGVDERATLGRLVNGIGDRQRRLLRELGDRIELTGLGRLAFSARELGRFVAETDHVTWWDEVQHANLVRSSLVRLEKRGLVRRTNPDTAWYTPTLWTLTRAGQHVVNLLRRGQL